MDISWSLGLDKFNDSEDSMAFAMTHSMIHETIYTAILSTGIVVNHYPLTDDLGSKDWLMTHAQEHYGIANALGLQIDYDFSQVDPNDPKDLEMWNLEHTNQHVLIDQALNL